jgi:hypothetical protein
VPSSYYLRVNLAVPNGTTPGSDRSVLYVNLGRTIEVTDSALAWDRMHLTP